MSRSEFFRTVTLAAVAALIPAAAEAHLVVTGMGPIYDGVSHFGLSPEDFLPVIVIGIFVGLRGPRASRLALGALPFSWLVGGIMASAGFALPQISLSLATAALFLIVGGMLAANLELPARGCVAIAALLGAVRGMADLSGVTLSGGHLLTILGISASVFVVFAIATSLTLPLQRAWMIIAARVSGSWLAASGLLLAGWIVRYGAIIR